MYRYSAPITAPTISRVDVNSSYRTKPLLPKEAVLVKPIASTDPTTKDYRHGLNINI